MWFPVFLLTLSTAWGDKLVAPVSPPDAALSGGHEGDIQPPQHVTSSKDAVILSYESSPNVGDGAYAFKFETSDGVSRVEEGELKNDVPEGPGEVVRGSYSYLGDDGVTYTVTYVADENGFQPVGDHLPTPHPEIVAALSQNQVEEEAQGGPAVPTAPSAGDSASAALFKGNPHYFTRTHYATPAPPIISQELVAPDLPVVPAVDSSVFIKSNPQYYAKIHYATSAPPIVAQEVVAQQPAVVSVDNAVHKAVGDFSPSAIFYKTNNPSHYSKFHYATPATIVAQEVVAQQPAVVSVDDAVHKAAGDSPPSPIFYKTNNPSHYAKLQHATPAPAAQIGYFKHYPAYDRHRKYYYKQDYSLKNNHHQLHNTYKNRYAFAFGTRYQAPIIYY